MGSLQCNNKIFKWWQFNCNLFFQSYPTAADISTCNSNSICCLRCERKFLVSSFLSVASANNSLALGSWMFLHHQPLVIVILKWRYAQWHETCNTENKCDQASRNLFKDSNWLSFCCKYIHLNFNQFLLSLISGVFLVSFDLTFATFSSHACF